MRKESGNGNWNSFVSANEVRLENQEGFFSVYSKPKAISVLSNNADLYAVKKLIETLQRELLKENELAKKDRKELLSWIQNEYCEIPAIYDFSVHTMDLLKILKLESEIVVDATFLLLKGLLFSGELLKFTVELEREMSALNDKGILSGKLDLILDEYFELVSKPDFQYPEQCHLPKDVCTFYFDGEYTLDFLENYTNIKEKLKCIAFFLCIRSYPFVDLEVIKKRYNEFDTSEFAFDDVIRQVLFFRKEQMKEVFLKMEKGNLQTKDYLEWHDGTGFNIFHYSIILNDMKFFKEILSLKKKSMESFTESEEYDMYKVFSCYLECTDMLSCLLHEQKEYQALMKEKKSIERRIKANEVGKEISSMIAGAANSAIQNGSYQYEDLRSGLDASNQVNSNAKGNIAQARAELAATEMAISEWMHQEIAKVEKLTAEFRQEDEADIVYMRKLAADKEYLKGILSEKRIQNFSLYKTVEGRYILLHEDGK